MKKEQLKRIFEFIEEKEGHNVPFLWKFKNNIPLTEKDLNVNGDLNLSDSKIKSLPEGLKVGGDLYLDGSYVESLPKGLEVYGDLYIADTVLASKSNDDLIVMIKPGFIKGEIINNEEEYDEGYDD
jgi:hypothetical protein